MYATDSELLKCYLSTLECMRADCLARSALTIYRADLLKFTDQIAALTCAIELMRNVCAGLGCLNGVKPGCRGLTNGPVKSK